MTWAFVATVGACFDPEIRPCLRCVEHCPSGQECRAGLCVIIGQRACASSEAAPICIDEKCPAMFPASPELWLDWTSLMTTESGVEWFDRSPNVRRTRATDPGPDVILEPNSGKPLLSLAVSDRYLAVPGLDGPLLGGEGFVLMLASAQRCQDLTGVDAQCILSRSSRDAGLRLCIAGPDHGVDIGECLNGEARVTACRAAIAPPTAQCGVIELLTLRRWTDASTAMSWLEIRVDGRHVHAEESDGTRLDSDADLRIGGAPQRPYVGEVALVALLSGSFDEPSTCRLERFVLERLQAAGLRDTLPEMEGCD
jgi:hypothetical protein